MRLDDVLCGVQTVAISGHVRPDGDCVGSTLAVYNYILKYYPEVHADIYLDRIPTIFRFMMHASDIQNDRPDGRVYDLFIACDCGDMDRLGDSAKYFASAKKTFCVDHHVSNDHFADENYIFPEASSTCELIFELVDDDKIDTDLAECIYTGMVHDTGVFQYSSTSSKTMRIAGCLMDKGIDFTRIVDETFYTKSYEQQRILGQALLKSRMYLDGKVIVSIITAEEMKDFGVESRHLEGIVASLRVTKGVEVAIFFYEMNPGEYKISLRSNHDVNVACITKKYGGGGHIKAAGCSVNTSPEEMITMLCEDIRKQLEDE